MEKRVYPTATQDDVRNGWTDAELLQAGYRYALAMTHHPEDAEDLVQDGWVRLCQRYGRVGSRAALFTTIRNLFIDQCRRRKIVAFESLDEEESSIVPLMGAAEPWVKGDLDRLLVVLRPNERELLFLHYHQGHTAEEIAQTTGQPRGTVLSLIHRAVAKLREAAIGTPGSSGAILDGKRLHSQTGILDLRPTPR